MTKMPPVPPENRSPKGTGDPKGLDTDLTPKGREHDGNPHQKGQQANTEQNTTHQGYQQNR